MINDLDKPPTKDYWTFLENQYQLSDLFHSKVWVATDDRRILLYAGADPENGSEVGRIMLPAAPLCQVSDQHHKTYQHHKPNLTGCRTPLPSDSHPKHLRFSTI